MRLLLLLLPLTALAAPQRLAVLELQDELGLGASRAGYLTELVRGEALKVGPRFLVMTRENMLSLLPPGTTLAECEGACEVETGRRIGAEFVVAGALAKGPGEEARVVLKLLHVGTGVLAAQGVGAAKTPAELEAVTARVAAELFAGLAQSKRADCDSPGSCGLLAVKMRWAQTPGLAGTRRFGPRSFEMGSPQAEAGRGPDERLHRVRLSHTIRVQATELTQGQWRQIMGSAPSHRSTCGDYGPVESVSWFDAVAYLNARSEAEGLESCYSLTGCTGHVGGGCQGEAECQGDYVCTSVRFKGPRCRGWRLPTEAEWESIARASGKGPYGGRALATLRYAASVGEGLDGTPCKGADCGPTCADAAGGAPLGWLGNVGEWVGDRYGPYPPGKAKDPTGPWEGAERVYRGGSFAEGPAALRAAARHHAVPSFRSARVGVRPVRTLR